MEKVWTYNQICLRNRHLQYDHRMTTDENNKYTFNVNWIDLWNIWSATIQQYFWVCHLLVERERKKERERERKKGENMGRIRSQDLRSSHKCCIALVLLRLETLCCSVLLCHLFYLGRCLSTSGRWAAVPMPVHMHESWMQVSVCGSSFTFSIKVPMRWEKQLSLLSIFNYWCVTFERTHTAKPHPIHINT